MAGLREILVSFGIDFDTAPLDKGNAKVESGLESLKKFGAALAGVFVVHEIKDFVFEMTESADVLAKQAQALGLTVTELQELQHAAGLAGVATGELNVALTKFNKNIAEAKDGAKGPLEAFKAVGIGAKQIKSLTPGQLFDEVAEGIARIADPTKRTQVAMDFFGRSGAKLIPLLKEGKAGMAALKAEVVELGGGFSEDFASASEEVNDQVTRLQFGITSLKVKIAGVLLPAVSYVVDKFLAWIKVVNRLAKETRIFETFLVALGIAASVSAARIIAAYLPVIAPFLAWAAAIGAIILIAEDLFGFFEGRRSLFGRWLDASFGPGTSDKVRAWAHAVVDLITWVGQTIKDIFFDSSKTVQEKFQALVAFFDGTFREKAQAVFGDVGGWFVTEMASAITEVIGLFEGAAEKILGIFKGVFDFIGKSVFDATDGAANEQAKLDAGARSGKPVATAADLQAHLDQGPWYMRAFAKVTGFDPAKSVPVRVPPAGGTGGGSPVTSAGSGGVPVPPVVNNITVPPGTPATLAARVGTAAHQGTAAALQAPNRAAAAGLGRTAPKT